MADLDKPRGKPKHHKRGSFTTKPESPNRNSFIGRLKVRVARAFHVKHRSRNPESQVLTRSTEELSVSKYEGRDKRCRKSSDCTPAVPAEKPVDRVNSHNDSTCAAPTGTTKCPNDQSLKPTSDTSRIQVSFRNELSAKLMLHPQSRPSKERATNRTNVSTTHDSVGSPSRGASPLMPSSSSDNSASPTSPTTFATGVRHRLSIGRKFNRRAPTTQSIFNVSGSSDLSCRNFFDSPSSVGSMKDGPSLPSSKRDIENNDVVTFPTSDSQIQISVPMLVSKPSSAASQSPSLELLTVSSDATTSNKNPSSISPSSSMHSPLPAFSASSEPEAVRSTEAVCAPVVDQEVFISRRRSLSDGARESKLSSSSSTSDARPKSMLSNTLSDHVEILPSVPSVEDIFEANRVGHKSRIAVATPLAHLTPDIPKSSELCTSPSLTSNSPLNHSALSETVNNKLPVTSSALNPTERVQKQEKNGKLTPLSERASLFGAVLRPPKPSASDPGKNATAKPELSIKNAGDRRSKVFDLIKNFEEVH